jgi:hypothetical protein
LRDEDTAAELVSAPELEEAGDVNELSGAETWVDELAPEVEMVEEPAATELDVTAKEPAAEDTTAEEPVVEVPSAEPPAELDPAPDEGTELDTVPKELAREAETELDPAAEKPLVGIEVEPAPEELSGDEATEIDPRAEEPAADDINELNPTLEELPGEETTDNDPIAEPVGTELDPDAEACWTIVLEDPTWNAVVEPELAAGLEIIAEELAGDKVIEVDSIEEPDAPESNLAEEPAALDPTAEELATDGITELDAGAETLWDAEE